MSKATAAKLAVLIFLAFIVCLPEFLPSNTVLQIQFHCVPFDSCGLMSWRGPEDGPICEAYENASKKNLLCEEPKKNTTNQNKAVKDWFVCETQADLQSLHDNASHSEVDVDVVLRIYLIDHPLLNVTMHGYYNHSELHIETHLNFTLAGCCARPREDCTYPNKVMPQPSPPSHKPVTSAELTTKQSPVKQDSTVHPLCPSNRRYCLLYYEGSNILDTQTEEGRWWGFSTTMWLSLVLVLVLLVLLSVWIQVYMRRCCFHKQSVRVPVAAHQPWRFSKRRVKSLGDLPNVSISVWSTEDEELFIEKTQKDYSREKLQLVYQEMYKRAGLSPIHEVSTTDISSEKNDGETRPDDTITEEGSEESLDFPLLLAHTQSLPCLHHRGHPSNKDEEEST